MYEIGSEFNYIDKENYAMQDLTAMYEGFGDVRFLRCGRDAIGYVCEDIKAMSKGRSDKDTDYVALLPALCCDSMYRPFEVHGVKVLFYGINEDLSVDTDSLKKTIDKAYKNGGDNTVVMVLTAVYYGITDIKELDACIKSMDSKVIVIEDVTQGVLAPDTFDKENADYIIGSIRKWMGVPDGAVAIKNCQFRGSKEGDSYKNTCQESFDKSESFEGSAKVFTIKPVKGENSFATERSKALKMKTRYLENEDQDLKAEFRALLGHAEDTLTDGADIYEISDESREYLQSVPLKNIVSTRNNNYDTLYELLEKSVHNNVYFKLFPKKNAENPAFMLPVLMDTDRLSQDLISGQSIDRDEFERLLAAKGIYAPVLWPVCDDAAKVSPISKNISDHILCFWIDQRYDRFDMVQTAECFEDVIGKLIKKS